MSRVLNELVCLRGLVSVDGQRYDAVSVSGMATVQSMHGSVRGSKVKRELLVARTLVLSYGWIVSCPE